MKIMKHFGFGKLRTMNKILHLRKLRFRMRDKETLQLENQYKSRLSTITLVRRGGTTTTNRTTTLCYETTSKSPCETS